MCLFLFTSSLSLSLIKKARESLRDCSRGNLLEIEKGGNAVKGKFGVKISLLVIAKVTKGEVVFSALFTLQIKKKYVEKEILKY